MDRKEIGKAFLIGLAVFIGLNVLLRIVTFSVAGALDIYFADIQNNPVLIVGLLLGSMMELPGTGMVSILGGTDLETILVGLSIILPGIIAALVVGIIANLKYERFTAWILITLVSYIIILIAGILDSTLYSPLTFEVFLKGTIAGLLINIAFDGFFAIILPEK